MTGLGRDPGRVLQFFLVLSSRTLHRKRARSSGQTVIGVPITDISQYHTLGAGAAVKTTSQGSRHIVSFIKLTHKQNGPMKEIKILQKKGFNYHQRHKENYFLDTIIGRKFGVSFVELGARQAELYWPIVSGNTITGSCFVLSHV